MSHEPPAFASLVLESYKKYLILLVTPQSIQFVAIPTQFWHGESHLRHFFTSELIKYPTGHVNKHIVDPNCNNFPPSGQD